MAISNEFKSIRSLEDFDKFIDEKILTKKQDALKTGSFHGKYISVGSATLKVNDLINKLEEVTKARVDRMIQPHTALKPKDLKVFEDSKLILDKIVKVSNELEKKYEGSSIIHRFFTRIAEWLGKKGYGSTNEKLYALNKNINSILGQAMKDSATPIPRKTLNNAVTAQRKKVTKDMPMPGEKLKMEKTGVKKLNVPKPTSIKSATKQRLEQINKGTPMQGEPLKMEKVPFKKLKVPKKGI